MTVSNHSITTVLSMGTSHNPITLVFKVSLAAEVAMANWRLSAASYSELLW